MSPQPEVNEAASEKVGGWLSWRVICWTFFFPQGAEEHASVSWDLTQIVNSSWYQQPGFSSIEKGPMARFPFHRVLMPAFISTQEGELIYLFIYLAMWLSSMGLSF